MNPPPFVVTSRRGLLEGCGLHLRAVAVALAASAVIHVPLASMPFAELYQTKRVYTRIPMSTKNSATNVRLTESQVKVLKFMVRQYQEGATPSVREICEEMGWSSPNAAHQHIRGIASKGLLELQGRGRTIRITPLAIRIYGKKS
jgi:hypothetical protein